MSVAGTAWVTRSPSQPLFPAKRRDLARLWLIMFLLLAAPAAAADDEAITLASLFQNRKEGIAGMRE